MYMYNVHVNTLYLRWGSIPETTLFSKKNELGLEPTTLCSLDECCATELLKRLRWLGLKSQIQHNTMQGQVSQIYLYRGSRFQHRCTCTCTCTFQSGRAYIISELGLLEWCGTEAIVIVAAVEMLKNISHLTLPLYSANLSSESRRGAWRGGGR